MAVNLFTPIIVIYYRFYFIHHHFCHNPSVFMALFIYFAEPIE